MGRRGELRKFSNSGAFFAESINEQQRDWPALMASIDATRFNSLAVVPLVVSDHAVGRLSCSGQSAGPSQMQTNDFSSPLPGPPPKRSNAPTHSDGVHQPRAQSTPARLSSALAVATTPGDVAREAVAGGQRALGAHSATCRLPSMAGARLPAWLGAGSRPCSPMIRSRSSARHRAPHFPRDERSSPLGCDDGYRSDLSLEVVSPVMMELGEPVTLSPSPWWAASVL